MNAMQLVLGLAGAGPLFLGKIGLEQLPAVLALGAAGLFAHYCMTNAFRVGDASLVVPMDFMRIPLIAVVGWWLYGEPLDVFVSAGAGLIISGILWNLHSEARQPPLPVNPVGTGGPHAR
jgi:drug/metabolite transporter (DMT)-like permease